MSMGHEFMRLGEDQPLGEPELSAFIEENIWPAAEHHWEADFYVPEKLDHAEDIIVDPVSDDYVLGGGKIELSLQLIDDTDYPLDDIGERITEDVALDIVVCLDMEGYKEDVSQRFQQKYDTELTVWEVVAYEFPLNGGTPSRDRYYVVKTAEGDNVDNERKSHKAFLKNISHLGKYALPQRQYLTSQDCIDIHNILLALDVPSEKISLSSVNSSENF